MEFCLIPTWLNPQVFTEGDIFILQSEAQVSILWHDMWLAKSTPRPRKHAPMSVEGNLQSRCRLEKFCALAGLENPASFYFTTSVSTCLFRCQLGDGMHASAGPSEQVSCDWLICSLS
jgi:hypothetical protein